MNIQTVKIAGIGQSELLPKIPRFGSLIRIIQIHPPIV
jgi:hypothetical protein